MSNSQQIATVQYYPKASSNLRLFALWYFLVLMTIWNIAGHTFLGFEQAWIAPMIAVTAAMFTQKPQAVRLASWGALPTLQTSYPLR
jgi:hypothetical protein